MQKLKREQPRLHRELCECIWNLHKVKTAIHELPEAYAIGGAVAEVLMLIEHATEEARDSFRDAMSHRK